MFKKICLLLLIMSCSISLCLMSNTYSRYVADTPGNIDISFAKWQILINNNDITNENSTSIMFEPEIDQNNNIASNTIGPTSKGYFDIDIDPSNVEVSFNYKINLDIVNENIPDLIISKYAILPNNYQEGNKLTYLTLENNTITDTLEYDNNVENFKFQPFTIRIYFEWYEGENEKMNDDDDTSVGIDAALNDTSFKINAGIEFEQIIDLKNTDETPEEETITEEETTDESLEEN